MARVLRAAGAAALGLLGLAALAFLYVMFVPPLGGESDRESRAQPPLPPTGENAWTEYAEALADLRQERMPDWLGAAATLPHLTPQQRAYLLRHPGALTHLRAGASRSSVAYFREPPTVTTPVPDLLALRHLAELAAAEARRLGDAGDEAGALELEAVAYRYGTDLAQLDAGLLLPITATGCRRTAAAALFASLGRDAPAAAFAHAARAVAEEDMRMPSAWQATASEWRLMRRTVEDQFLGANDGTAGPRAFRRRVFVSFLAQHDAVLDEARPLLESWDFPGLGRLDERLLPALQSRASPQRSIWVVDNTAARMVAGMVAPLGRPARVLYVDRANGAAFQVLAACRAYQLAHGRFPADPRDALTEAGLAWPSDPVSGRPIGLRLEAGGAAAWLAGFDGKDDGGRVPYLDLLQATITPGSDLVYRLGELPPTLRTLAASAAAHPGP